MSSLFIALVLVVQVVLATRVITRMVRTASGTRIQKSEVVAPDAKNSVSVLVPVLNEATRIEPCLIGLIKQGPEVGEIIVVDGGSTDRTSEVISNIAGQDSRIRQISAAPVPEGVNGKAYGLAVASAKVHPDSTWVIVIDADVRPETALISSMLAYADLNKLGVLSVATRQHLSGPAEGILHPSMLATLVYRFGIPGHATSKVESVQANGQCMLVRRELLHEVGGFASVVRANAEDVTLARSLAAAGHEVGFHEADDLVSVEMYSSWREAWQGWARSLPMRDRYSTWRMWVGLAEVALIQAAPLLIWPISVWLLGSRHPLALLNGGLVFTRLGMLIGMSRAYKPLPLTYWLSPLADVPVAVRLMVMAGRRQFVWRGRPLVTGDIS